ncbi:hypothetical protein DNL98_22955 [Salmonella enterica subsp. enterica serovar Glostrup]|nr:hypothetical protein [Salmonella enterica subsp. enterica serovar Glostrup]
MKQQPANTPTDQQRFNAYESYFREYMTARLYRNIFNFICFVQVILGSAFMAEITSGWLAGLISTVLAAYIFVYNPGEIAGAAKKQAARYENVLHHMDSLTAEELSDAVSRLAETDSAVPELLIDAAYINADTAINDLSERTVELKKRLTIPERIAIFLSGCMIKTP